MTKQQFIKRMKEFIEIRNEIASINNRLMKSPLNEANWQYPIGYAQMEELFVKTMSEAMNDEDGWIDYWVYDLDCGKVKGSKIKNLNDLYTKLTTNSNKNEKMDTRRG